jgi:hypothetical protein
LIIEGSRSVPRTTLDPEPDPGGPQTYGSYGPGSGSRSATLATGTGCETEKLVPRPYLARTSKADGKSCAFFKGGFRSRLATLCDFNFLSGLFVQGIYFLSIFYFLVHTGAQTALFLIPNGLYAGSSNLAHYGTNPDGSAFGSG